MSLTSKVSNTLRTSILALLANGTQMSNAAIEVRLGYGVSLRKIQEATQKMTADGTLTKSKSGAFTFYGITPKPAAIEVRLGYDVSLRKIQEATQKMTADGTLTKSTEATAAAAGN